MAVSRRVWTLSAAALAVAGFVGMSGCGQAPTQQPSGERVSEQPSTATPAFEMPVEKPNLLMITVDDLSALDMDYLPSVKKLVGDSGVTFTDAVAPPTYSKTKAEGGI